MPNHNNLLYNWNFLHFCKCIPPPTIRAIWRHLALNTLEPGFSQRRYLLYSRKSLNAYQVMKVFNFFLSSSQSKKFKSFKRKKLFHNNREFMSTEMYIISLLNFSVSQSRELYLDEEIQVILKLI